MVINGISGGTPTGRASELQQVFEEVIPELVDFVRDADQERNSHRSKTPTTSSSLLKCPSKSRAVLQESIQDLLQLPEKGTGPQGMRDLVKTILDDSVNTSAPGFLDKLYAAPLPPGILAECVLGVLNTNLHVYQVSPVLTLIEKRVTKDLAAMFGLKGPRSGGISVQGGSSSNLTSIVIARNTLFPETKTEGNSVVDGQLLLFTSAHGHYSVEKAAQALGFGSKAVVSVPVDDEGSMDSDALELLIQQAKQQGKVPFYINATAGTTVLGSFDPFEKIAKIARRYRLWLHVDAAWGGGFAFSRRYELQQRLHGIGLADSIATNPHKMLGVPVTCSFLLGKDMRQFEQANTLKAGYLFHEEAADDATSESKTSTNGVENAADDEDLWSEPYDLADMTLQCGRRGDSLKFFLSWKYYGTHGYIKMVEDAYDVAVHMSKLVRENPDLTPVPKGFAPSCLQVCFYYTPQGQFSFRRRTHSDIEGVVVQTNGIGQSAFNNENVQLGKSNTRLTANIAKALIKKGFMIDFAPALEGQEEKGSFFRVVVNISTIRETVEKLVSELVQVGDSITATSSGSK